MGADVLPGSDPRVAGVIASDASPTDADVSIACLG